MATPTKGPTIVDGLDVSYERLHRTLCDHIDRRAIDLGVLTIARTNVELRELVSHLVATMDDRVRSRIAIASGSAIDIHADPHYIGRAILAILRVSLDAAPRSAIGVSLSCRGQRALVTVTSVGNAAAVKTRAALASPPATRCSNADHLGLYVAHHTITAHGGRLTVAEQPGPRTVMTIDLPLPIPELSAPHRAATPLPAPRVLVVEDNLEQVAALVLLLRTRGFIPDVATTGAEALPLVEAHIPDVLIVDGKLPDTTPAALIRRIRSMAPGTPAVLMTGYAIHHPAVLEALALGRTTYLGKPMDIALLFHELRRALQ